MCKITAILPVYNVENYIKDCLTSIKNQTFSDFEVLCIDDCGTDNSVEIINEFIKEDGRFKIIKHDQNKGQACARNTGIDNAKGEYLIFIDPDDIVDINQFEKIYNAFQNYDVDCVWYNAGISVENTGEKSVVYNNHFILNNDGLYDIKSKDIHKFTDYIWNKAFKTSVIKNLNLRFPEGIRFGEDSEFYYKAFTQIKRIYYINECLYMYRLRDNSSVDRAKRGELNLKDTFKVFMNIFNYMEEKNIVTEYKEAICHLLIARINNRTTADQNEKVLRMADEVLSKINFPDLFIEK